MELKEIKIFPTLYALTRTGKTQQWTPSVFENVDNGWAILRMEYGQVGGKIAKKDRNIKKGKNIGKANETTTVEQALSEAQSHINKKRDSNYEYEQPGTDYVPRVILPQLAKGVKHGKIVFPCFMQKKLNGVCVIPRRVLCHSNLITYLPEYITWKRLTGDDDRLVDEIVYHSRGGKLFHTMEHMSSMLRSILNPWEFLHGEFYHHDWSLQKIGSYTKDLKEDSHLLQLWVYDRPVMGNTAFSQRLAYLRDTIKAEFSPTIRVLDTVTVKSYEEAKEYHDEWVSQGFEGGMLRNMDGKYLFEFNSNDLEKVKGFEDAEFRIIGAKADVDDCCVFRCITEDGIEFDVRPKGSVAKRKQYLAEIEQLIDKDLMVKFAERSDDNVPLQPVGIVIRDYE